MSSANASSAFGTTQQTLDLRPAFTQADYWIGPEVWAEEFMADMSTAERLCYLAGLLPLARQRRGQAAVFTGGEADIAHAAREPIHVAASMLAILRRHRVVSDCPDGLLVTPIHHYRASSDRPSRRAFTARELDAIAARIAFYGGLCWICRTAPYEAIDHVKPVAHGGCDLPANLRPACRSCNSSKGAKWPFTRPGAVTA